jgi:hypothetical protein
VRSLAQVQFVDQLFVAICFCLAQIIEQAPALRDHFKQAAARGMIFAVGLEVFGQMLDPAGEKCDLHIRAAGIFFMQLELLEAQRFVALCHNEGATLDEERVLATAHPQVRRLRRVFLAFTVVPKAQSRARPRRATRAEHQGKDHDKEITENLSG